MTGPSTRARAVATGLLVVAGLVTLGRLALEAWLVKPTPDVLPRADGGAEPGRAAGADASGAGGTASATRPPALFVGIVDGLRAEAVSGPEASMPRWQGLASEGASGIGVTGEPTLTACCVRTILTGRNPDLVTAFRNFTAQPTEGSWLQFLVERGARAAHAGDAAAWQMTQRWIRTEDALAFPDRGPADQGGTDDQSLPFALAKAQDPDVDVLVVHVVRPDHAGHKHGATSREYREACAIVDEQMARLVTAFRAKRPEATVLLTADHGVTPRGTHGGGEPGARRAPFLLVGPRVARIADVNVPQASLAPTLCALLRLPPPPLAEAPPVFELTTLPPGERAGALDAYLRARLEVARRIGAADVAAAIDARRAQVFRDTQAQPLERLVAECRALEASAFATHGTSEVGLALALALGWLLALTRLAAPGARGPSDDREALLVSAAALVLAGALPLVGAAVAFGVACAWVGRLASPAPTEGSRRLVLAGVLGFPVVGASGLLLQQAFDAAEDAGPAARRLVLALGILALAVALALASRARRRALGGLLEAHPALLPLLAGVPLGFALSLRLFVDPFVHTPILFAVGAGLALVAVSCSRAARERAPRARLAVLAGGAVLFGGGRVAEGLAPDWILSPAAAGLGWRLASLAGATALIALAWPRATEGRRSYARELALLGLAAAIGVRLAVGPLPVAWWACLGLSLSALGVSAFRGSPAERLFARLVACVALGSLLHERSDVQLLGLVLLGLGCLAASRLPAPRTRFGVACAAVVVLAVRIAAFHALGFLESFSTIDTGAGIVPGAGQAAAEARGSGGGLTPEVALNVALQLLKFSLVWISLLSAVVFAWERDGRADALPRFGADLSLSFAARGAALVLGMWVWWRSSWWVAVAYPVFVLGLGDVVLLLLALALVGGLRRSPRPAPPATVGRPPVPAAAAT